MDPVVETDARGTGTIEFDFAGRRWRARLYSWRAALTPPPEPADGGPRPDPRMGAHCARHAQKLVNRYYRAAAR